MKSKKMWLAASGVCIILGIIILMTGKLLGGKPGFYINGKGVHTAGEETEPVRGMEELGEFDRMEVDVDYADVEIVASDRFAVEYCLTGDKGEPVCEVKNGKFTFKEGEYTRIIDMGFFIDTSDVGKGEPDYYVKIEVPKDEKLSEAELRVESGDLKIVDFQVDELEIVNEYGDVSVDKFTGKGFMLNQDSGDAFIGSLTAEHIGIESEYGNIRIEEAGGGSLAAVLDSGDCRILKLAVSEAEIKNEYGNVTLAAAGDLETYELELYTEYGRIRAGDEVRDNYDDDEARYESRGDGQKKIKICCDDGDIEIDSVK